MNYNLKEGASYIDDLNAINYHNNLNRMNSGLTKTNLNNSYNPYNYNYNNMNYLLNNSNNTNSLNPYPEDYLYNQYPYNNQVAFNQNLYRTNELDYTLYYPVIYRIINPVVKKAIYSSNNFELDENLLNNLTDTVFNIVDGDVIKEEKEEGNINLARDNNLSTSGINNQSNVQNNNNNKNPYKNENNSNEFLINEKCKNIRDELVKDYIRTLIINEYRLIHNSITHNQSYINRY